MESEIINALLRRLAERKHNIEEGLAVGGARSYDDYCKLVGEYAALAATEDEVRDLVRKYVDL